MSFGSSFAAGASVRQNKMALQQQEMALQQKERQQTIENINAIATKEMESIRGIYQAAAQKGLPLDSPEVMEAVTPIRNDLAALLGKANPMFPNETLGLERALKEVDTMSQFIATPKDTARLNRLTTEDIESDPSIPESVRIAARDGMLVEVNQHGMLVVSNPASTGEESDVRDRKIADLVNMYPRLGRAKAVALVDGHARIETDPQGGIVRWINEASGEVMELPIGASSGGLPTSGPPSSAPESPDAPEQPASPAGQTLYELAGIATGPVATAKAAAAFGVGFLPEGIRESGIFPDATIEARQRFAAETQNVIRAISINNRFPVMEMERIRKEINVMPRFLDNPPMMRARMRGLDFTLEQRHADAMRDASDTSLPGETRRNARQSARGIENFRRQMGVPEPLSLDSIADVQSAEVETLRGFVNSASDDDLARLPEDVSDAILKRIRGQ